MSVERSPGFGFFASGLRCLPETVAWPPAPLPARRAYRPEGRAYGSERHGTIGDMGDFPPGILQEVNVVHVPTLGE